MEYQTWKHRRLDDLEPVYVWNATAVIWKTLLVAEQIFRRLDAPERLPDSSSSSEPASIL